MYITLCLAMPDIFELQWAWNKLLSVNTVVLACNVPTTSSSVYFVFIRRRRDTKTVYLLHICNSDRLRLPSLRFLRRSRFSSPSEEDEKNAAETQHQHQRNNHRQCHHHRAVILNHERRDIDLFRAREGNIEKLIGATETTLKLISEFFLRRGASVINGEDEHVSVDRTRSRVRGSRGAVGVRGVKREWVHRRHCRLRAFVEAEAQFLVVPEHFPVAVH